MSVFYEVTAASGTAAAGDESASWHDSANTLVSHPAAGRTITAASDAARSPSPLALQARYEGDRPTALREPSRRDDATQHTDQSAVASPDCCKSSKSRRGDGVGSPQS